jgi:undecaprenyl-diphosphatase
MIISFIWFLNQSKIGRKEILIIICISFPLAFIVSKVAGHLYYNPQPFVLGHFQPLIPSKADNGFPSHHTLLVSAISTVIFIFSRRMGFVLWVLALFVGFSRVYAGVHHTIDIVGSMLISIISVTLVYFFRKQGDGSIFLKIFRKKK